MKKERGKNILLIADDDLFIRKVINKGLSELAITIEEVTDGDAVVETYRRLMPDVLILDIHLPGKSGIDLIAEIQACDPEAYIVMISADSTTENVNLVRGRGIKGFLTKPVDKARLLKLVNSCPTVVYHDQV